MFKKILIITGYSLLTIALGAYFWFSAKLVRDKSAQSGLKKIHIVITDSAQNRFVNSNMIRSVLVLEGVTENESFMRHINPYDIERRLKQTYNIKIAQAYTNIKGELHIAVQQRRPLLRLQIAEGGFYLDDESYIFPLDTIYTADVPVVTGNIPLTLFPGYKGAVKENKEWADAMLELGEFIASEPLWNSLIEQIDIDDKSELHITPRVGNHDINFGRANEIKEKFTKLEAFYKDILPNKGWERYKEVDLRFENQVVCKLRNHTQIKDTTIKI